MSAFPRKCDIYRMSRQFLQWIDSLNNFFTINSVFSFVYHKVIFLQLQVNPLIASTKQHYFIIGRDKRIG